MLIYFGIKELLKPTTFKGKLVSKRFKPIRSDDIAQWDLEFESDQEEIKKAFVNAVTNGTKLKKECEKWLRLISNEIARRKKILFTKVEGVGLDWNNTYSQRMRLNSDTSHLGLGVDKLTDDEKWLKVVQGWCKKAEDSDYLASTKNIAKLTEDWCTKEGVNQ